MLENHRSTHMKKMHRNRPTEFPQEWHNLYQQYLQRLQQFRASISTKELDTKGLLNKPAQGAFEGLRAISFGIGRGALTPRLKDLSSVAPAPVTDVYLLNGYILDWFNVQNTLAFEFIFYLREFHADTPRKGMRKKNNKTN